MATKILTVSPTGRIRRCIAKPCTDQRIVELHKALGATTKEAYNKLKFINCRIEAALILNPLN